MLPRHRILRISSVTMFFKNDFKSCNGRILTWNLEKDKNAHISLTRPKQKVFVVLCFVWKPSNCTPETLATLLRPKSDHEKSLTSWRNKHSFSANSWSIEEQIGDEISSLREFEENRLKPHLLRTLWRAKKSFYVPDPPFSSRNIFWHWQESILISQFNFHKIGTRQFSHKPSQGSQNFFLHVKVSQLSQFYRDLWSGW